MQRLQRFYHHLQIFRAKIASPVALAIFEEKVDYFLQAVILTTLSHRQSAALALGSPQRTREAYPRSGIENCDKIIPKSKTKV